MIDVLAFSTGVLSKANPFKIIAGLDPEETNGLLQLLAKAVIKKADFKKAVTRVLNGEHFGAEAAAPEIVNEVKPQYFYLVIDDRPEIPVARVEKEKEKKKVTLSEDTEVREIPKEEPTESEEGLNNENLGLKTNEATEEQPAATNRRARPISARPPPPKSKKVEHVKEERVLYLLL